MDECNGSTEVNVEDVEGDAVSDSNNEVSSPGRYGLYSLKDGQLSQKRDGLDSLKEWQLSVEHPEDEWCCAIRWWFGW